MWSYIGCFLFGMIFVVMSAQQTGSLQARMTNTWAWIHNWAPYSYVLIAFLMLAPAVMVHLMHTWPKYVEPDDPMAKYRREASDPFNDTIDD